MHPDDREALYALAPMRDLHHELCLYHAGPCVLHLEAAIAALESHLRRRGDPMLAEAGEAIAPSTRPA